jgi:hypothetical protein
MWTAKDGGLAEGSDPALASNGLIDNSENWAVVMKQRD